MCLDKIYAQKRTEKRSSYSRLIPRPPISDGLPHQSTKQGSYFFFSSNIQFQTKDHKASYEIGKHDPFKETK